jgi:hypothetical protein
MWSRRTLRGGQCVCRGRILCLVVDGRRPWMEVSTWELAMRLDALVDTLDPFPSPRQQDSNTPTQNISLSTTPLQPTLDLALQDIHDPIRLHIGWEEGGRDGETVRDDIGGAFLEDGCVFEGTGEEGAEGVGGCFGVDSLL